MYWGCVGNPGGDDGVADVLALAGEGEVADGLADDGGDVADGLALADGVAIEEGLEDFGVAEGEEDLDDLGVDGGVTSSGSEEQSWEAMFSKQELSLTPATLSQSMAWLRFKMTFSLKWNDPEANPSWMVWTEKDTAKLKPDWTIGSGFSLISPSNLGQIPKSGTVLKSTRS